jgi:hypothetical protein
MTESRTRARCLATAQCTDAEVAARLSIELEMPFDDCERLVAQMTQELVTCRHMGRSVVRERTYMLATGELVEKVTGANLAAMETFGRAYLNLDEHQKLAKLVEKAERKVAAGSKPGLKAVGS